MDSGPRTAQSFLPCASVLQIDRRLSSIRAPCPFEPKHERSRWLRSVTAVGHCKITARYLVSFVPTELRLDFELKRDGRARVLEQGGVDVERLGMRSDITALADAVYGVSLWSTVRSAGSWGSQESPAILEHGSDNGSQDGETCDLKTPVDQSLLRVQTNDAHHQIVHHNDHSCSMILHLQPGNM